MKKITVLIAILSLLILAPFVTGDESVQTSLIPDNAVWVVHIDVNKLSATQFKDLLFGDHNRFQREVRKVERIAKIDFFKDIKGITILGMGVSDDNTVVAVSGRVNKDWLISLLGMEESLREIQYDNFTLYNWDRREYGVFARDDLVLVGGDKYAIQNVLDTLSGKRKNISGPLLSKLKEWPQDAFLMAAAEDISAIAEGDDIPSVVLKKTGMASFIAREKNGMVNLALSLDTESLETAKNVHKIVDALFVMASMHEDVRIDKSVLNAIDISLQGKVVRMEVNGAPEDLFRLIFGLGIEFDDIIDY
jgi:hypothetical protein